MNRTLPTILAATLAAAPAYSASPEQTREQTRDAETTKTHVMLTNDAYQGTFNRSPRVFATNYANSPASLTINPQGCGHPVTRRLEAGETYDGSNLLEQMNCTYNDLQRTLITVSGARNDLVAIDANKPLLSDPINRTHPGVLAGAGAYQDVSGGEGAMTRMTIYSIDGTDVTLSSRNSRGEPLRSATMRVAPNEEKTFDLDFVLGEIGYAGSILITSTSNAYVTSRRFELDGFHPPRPGSDLFSIVQGKTPNR